MHAPPSRQRIRALSRSGKTWTTSDTEAIERLAVCEAVENFWAYRQWISPKMLLGWWQEIIAIRLQEFFDKLLRGEKPYLVIESPPQHGKSRNVTEFVSWATGHNPDLKTIFTSYSDDLGVRVNKELQRIYDSPRYKKAFPGTALWMTNSLATTNRPARNSSLLEFVEREGSFRNTTVEGQVTGMGLDLGLVDDPIKGRAEAQSKRNRDKVWDWLMDDFFTRFAENAGMIFTMTRWHVDDPVSRFLEKFPNATVVRYPAIAEQDEYFNGHLLRHKGEALFPEHKSLEFLLQRKGAMTIASWEALYQQNPIIVGGGMFPIEKFKHVPKPGPKEVKKSVRYWDKAGTQDAGAYTAGCLMHLLKDNSLVISDVRRGQWSYHEREQRIRQMAEVDKATYGNVRILIEQEPGSGGKESVERTIANLLGFPVEADRVTGSKEVRAEPYAGQVQGGNVGIVAADWNGAFLDEHEAFPNYKYKDQVDAAAGACAKLSVRGYDTSLSWV